LPHQTPLQARDPRWVGRYQLTGRLQGIPSDDPIFLGAGRDGTQVAISVLSGEWSLDGAARDRFTAEAAVARRVPPFCAARVLDAGLDGSDAYLVSEYIPGQSLLELVAADGVRRGHDLEALAIGMATGLASVHQAGLVHGNFGPEFVIMASDGSPRVVEFGITPPYGSATPSADMLAWGETVVFAASGRPPAALDDLDVLPDQLRGPVERCLDPEAGGRPAARAVVQSLLGDQHLPAGVLAEGSRRAVRPARSGYDHYQAGTRQPGSGQAGIHPLTGRSAARLQHKPGSADLTTEAGAGTRRLRGALGTHGSGRGPGSGRRTAWLIGGAVVVIAVGGLVVRLAQDSGDPASNGRLSANTGVASKSQSPTAPAAASPSRGALTPAAFDGSWTGLVKQPPTDTYDVSVSFTAGTTSGTVSYAGTDFSCSGALNLTKATAHKLIMSQGIIQGQSNCENGQVTITLTAPDTIWFSFRSSGPIAAGALTRSLG
jgi:hypothetical protein